jgi:hypothetical protein
LKAGDGWPLMTLVVAVSGLWKSGRKETEAEQFITPSSSIEDEGQADVEAGRVL